MRIHTLEDIRTPLAPQTLSEWEAERAEMLRHLRFCSDYDLLCTDAPLNARVFDATEANGIVVEKVILESLPGFYVTGNLYRPKDTAKKYPAILNPHGHWTDGRFEMRDLAQIPTRCANFAMRGMVAFAYDMIGFGDNTRFSHSAFSPEWEKWLYGRFALQLNNSRRALDFVASLPYVDAGRIGCTGCSGGGTQTYFISALDERIRAAAPINMASVRFQGGCICENTALLRTKYCNVDYTALTAPRPLFMAAADGDWTVTSETAEFPAVRHIYGLYGAEDRFRHFYQHAPHCYNQPTRTRVYQFFCDAFGVENAYAEEQPFELPVEKLKIGALPEEAHTVYSDEALFEQVKALICKNLASYTAAQKADTLRRIFAMDAACALDIPYTLAEDVQGNVTVTLGECPNLPQLPVSYLHTYNLATDTRRVNGLAHLFAEYPNAKVCASGKTAALCAWAAKLSPKVQLELTEPNETEIHIPGSEIAKRLLSESIQKGN